MVTETQKKSSNEGVWNGDGDTEKVWAGCVVQESKKKNMCIVFSINNIFMEHIVHLILYVVILLLLHSSF